MSAGRLVRWVVLPVLLVVLSAPLPDCRAAASFEAGGLSFLAHSAHPDPLRRQTTFSITFDRAPDFFSTDEPGDGASDGAGDGAGNPRHGFQYFYDAEPGGFEFAGEDVRII